LTRGHEEHKQTSDVWQEQPYTGESRGVSLHHCKNTRTWYGGFRL